MDMAVMITHSSHNPASEKLKIKAKRKPKILTGQIMTTFMM
jgi:hypothetical protein